VAARPPLAAGQNRPDTTSPAQASSTPTPDPTTEASTAGPTTRAPARRAGYADDNDDERDHAAGRATHHTAGRAKHAAIDGRHRPRRLRPVGAGRVAELTGLGLTVTESQVGTASQCYVIDQTPGAGSVVAVGATVHIVVAIQLGPFCGVA
jgi:hypothetical protein